MRASVTDAAAAVRQAEALLITGGAGMGVDSGLPDFRGDKGFWNAYPVYATLGLSFVQLANPDWFERDPELAWGFYGHRLGLYRATVPHRGFGILKKWAERIGGNARVATSNVDGHFQKAGFAAEHVFEIHGSIHFLQCVRRCGVEIFPAEGVEVAVDAETFRATGTLPACPECGGLARPNILMFNDFDFDACRANGQEKRLREWMAETRGQRLIVIEMGAGLAIPSIRRMSEEAARREGAMLIRINPREADVTARILSLAMGALAALRGIDAEMTLVPGWDA